MSFKFKVITKTNLMVRTGPGTSFSDNGRLAPGTTHTGYAYEKDSSGNTWVKMAEKKYCCTGIGKDKYVTIMSSTGSSSKPTTDTDGGGKEPVDNIDVGGGESTAYGKGLHESYEKISNTKKMTLDSAVDGSVRLFGLPHQFLPHNDVRISDKSKLGRLFAENIVLEAPSLFIKPGTSKFLPGMSEEDKTSFMQSMMSLGTDAAKKKIIDRVSSASGDDPLKYFEHKTAYSDYIRRVNMVARAMAIFLKIDKEPVPWAKGVTFGLYDWRYYKFKSMYVDNTPTLKNEYNTNKHSSIGQFIDETMQTVHDKIMDDYEYVQYYIDASSSFSESSSNSTQASLIDSTMSKFEGMAKELYTLSGVSGIGLDELGQEMTTNLDSFVQTHADGNTEFQTFMRRLSGGAKQLIAGGNFIVPEVWSDSNYSKSYNITIPLSTPYGNVMSWYINIAVPLAHILATALPHQLTANTYKMPYLVKAFSPGWFSIENGIIESISIEKGGGGDAWNGKGLCNEMKITLSIKDLYTTLAIPASYKPGEFMNNTGLLEFLMVNCGVDLTKPELAHKFQLITNMFLGSVTDTIGQTPYDLVMGFKNFTSSMFKVLD